MDTFLKFWQIWGLISENLGLWGKNGSSGDISEKIWGLSVKVSKIGGQKVGTCRIPLYVSAP